MNILLLPGDGIGPEIIEQTRRVLERCTHKFDLGITLESQLIGGAAIDAGGDPFPEQTASAVTAADAVLLGAVGGPKWDHSTVRPEQGLLSLRAHMQVFANLRPVKPLPALTPASPIKAELLAGVDIMVVRELTGGIYFGEKQRGDEFASDLCIYHCYEIERIVRRACDMARLRRGKITMVDKANVLETSRLWRSVTERLVKEEYPELELEILLVDAAAMHLLSRPADFDVLVTENMFGDILTDEASMLAGSLGVLPSASLGAGTGGLFEPIHGSAPDIAGQNSANPCGAILSAAMMFRYALDRADICTTIENAVEGAIEAGETTADIGGELSTSTATDAVLKRI